MRRSEVLRLTLCRDYDDEHQALALMELHWSMLGSRHGMVSVNKNLGEESRMSSHGQAYR